MHSAASNPRPRSFRVGGCLFDPSRSRAVRQGRSIHVESKPMQVMAYLAERAGRVAPKDAIFRDVWPGTFVTDDALTKCISELRKIVGDNPRSPKVIQTVHRIGYTIIAPVTFVDDEQSARRIIAVLPFDNFTGHADNDFIASGLAEEITAQLSRLDPKRVGVIARTTMEAYKNLKIPVDRIGVELGADYVLEGSIKADMGRFRVTAQLIRSQDQIHVWADSFDMPEAELLSVQWRIANAIAAQIRRDFAPELGAPAVSPVNSEAHRLCLKGRYFWNKRTRESMDRAVSYYRRAVEAAPDYGPARCGLADCHNMMAYWLLAPPGPAFAEAREQALAALQAAPDLADAHAALAYNDFEGRWDWASAEQGYLRALELNPNHVPARQWYAEYLAITGRIAEAETQLAEAEALDPLSLPLKILRSAMHFMLGDAACAVEELLGIVELDPAFPETYHLLGDVYRTLGQHQDALRCWLEFHKLTGAADERLASACAAANFEDFLRTEIDILSSAAHYVSPIRIAMKHATLNDADAALLWLAKSYEERCPWLLELRYDPVWDPIRSDARFQSLLGSIGLPD
jgi:TolB-like protein/Tfp pilus assembly protein PilF